LEDAASLLAQQASSVPGMQVIQLFQDQQQLPEPFAGNQKFPVIGRVAPELNPNILQPRHRFS
jgi:hypothetical protein